MKDLEKQVVDLMKAINQASDEEAKGKGFIVMFAKDNEDGATCRTHVAIRGDSDLLIPALSNLIENDPGLFNNAKKCAIIHKLQKLFSGALGSIN